MLTKDCHGARRHFYDAAAPALKWNHIIYAAVAATNRRSGMGVVMVVIVPGMVVVGMIVVGMVMTGFARLVLVKLLP